MNLQNVLLFNTLLPSSRSAASASRLTRGGRQQNESAGGAAEAAAAASCDAFRTRINTEPPAARWGAQSMHRRPRAPVATDGAAAAAGGSGGGRRWSTSAMPRSVSEPIGPIAELPEPDASAAACAPPPPSAPATSTSSRPLLCPHRCARVVPDRSNRVCKCDSHAFARSHICFVRDF